MNFYSHSKKNTVSFLGANFAPSCRAFENNTENMLMSGTALAVSVLFTLISVLGIIMLSGIISIDLISMLIVTIMTTSLIKE